MDTKIAKSIGLVFALILITLIVAYAINVFLLGFAAVLLAILLNAIGRGAKRISHLPYPLALFTALAVIIGVLTLIFWLYSPLIADQFQRLMDQLPQAANMLRNNIAPYLGDTFFSESAWQKEFSFANQKVMSQLLAIFSFTIGSIVSFAIFLIVGLYLAMAPQRYVKGLLFLIPKKKQERFWSVVDKIGRSLRWWLLGKFLSMLVIGILTYIGLWIMGVSLAFILGLVMALLTFIPYVGPVIASIPAILIAFAQNPLLAIYVTILYLAIHVAEGYLITPFIEQKTVSIPPALTIMAQVLMIVLVGGLGLALASPLIVVCIALAQYSSQRRETKTPIAT